MVLDGGVSAGGGGYDGIAPTARLRKMDDEGTTRCSQMIQLSGYVLIILFTPNINN